MQRTNSRCAHAACAALALVIVAGCDGSLGKSAQEQRASVRPPSSFAPTTTSAAIKGLTTVAPTTFAPTTVAPTIIAPTTIAPTPIAPTAVPYRAPRVPHPPITVAPQSVASSPPATPAPASAPAAGIATLLPPSSAESTLVEGINDFRGAHGLPALAIHAVVVNKARDWAEHMARGGCGRGGGGVANICHSPPSNGITVPWARLAENVGIVSPRTNASGMETAFEQSPAHAENMLNNQIQYVGVGVSYADNYMYVAEEFMAT